MHSAPFLKKTSFFDAQSTFLEENVFLDYTGTLLGQN